ncbi:MAG: N-acetyl-1-D-myo-inositol-2-amino-2-deoxy-alpha-D-glucopyranoside deacetylase [Actinomycetota bacterium]|nr:N-acetyl-1-D-myo-inositol-2-amino-2-deoxy-alpha-D-glucopyranoside deacetylase [Actinomycetota bacterium]
MTDRRDTLGLLCVHPHPDDESIACGGVLARYADEGLRVAVVTCTGGEEGENLSGVDLGGEDMVVVRRRELAAAIAVLGVTDHRTLGYRDSGMAGEPSNEHPDSFHRADLDEAALRLAAIIREFRPAAVVSDDERGTYGHPDHVKAHTVTGRAIELAAEPDAALPGTPWEVAKWYVHVLPRSRLHALHRRLLDAGIASPFGRGPVPDGEDMPFGVADERVTTAVDVRPWLGRKRAAMRAHASQIGADSFFLNLPDDVSQDVFGIEYFVIVRGTPASADVEHDVFAGLRGGDR